MQVIIHAAATIRFNEQVKLASRMNILAVNNILALARDLKHCAAVVHTSTAYVHTYRPDCPESFLEPSHDPEDLLELLNRASVEVADAATAALIKRHPNTCVHFISGTCLRDVTYVLLLLLTFQRGVYV